MTDLFNHYEQQFGNISAEITARICKIPNLHGSEFQQFGEKMKLTFVILEPFLFGEILLYRLLFLFCLIASKKAAITDVQRCLDEARELVRTLTDLPVILKSSMLIKCIVSLCSLHVRSHHDSANIAI